MTPQSPSLRLLLLLPLLALHVGRPCHAAEAQPSEKPNIVFLFADDQSAKTIGAYGNEQIKTPHLDRLVREGASFTNAYNMGAWNGAVCQASRAMIISGLSVWQAYDMDQTFKAGGGVDRTWGKLMERQGYDTYMTGKWHVSAPASKVFQHTTHIRPGMPKDNWDHRVGRRYAAVKAGEMSYESFSESMPLGYNRPLSKEPGAWSPTDPKHGGYWEGGKHWSEVLKDDALTFIDRAKNDDSPFFMYLAFNAPHDPRQAPQAYQDLYDPASLELPVSWQPLYPEKDAIGNGPGLRDAALAPFPRTEEATRVHLKEYYAIVSHLDAQVGQILDAIEASGKADNTYIIYTADHGLAVGEHGLLGKQSMYDHSVRAPFIIKGPGIKGGTTVATDIYLQDAMATALELAGTEKPGHVFFNSVLPLATGESNRGSYDSIYGAYINSQRMIKKEGFKLIVYPKANTLKLFDLDNDPDELTNLAGVAAYDGRVRSLFELLLSEQERLGDRLDLKPMFESLGR